MKTTWVLVEGCSTKSILGTVASSFDISDNLARFLKVCLNICTFVFKYPEYHRICGLYSHILTSDSLVQDITHLDLQL